MSLRTRVVIAAAIAATTVACSSTSGTAEPGAGSGPTSTSATATSTAPSKPYTATTATVSEVRGKATLDIVIPQVAGPDDAVVSKFNSSVRTYVDQQATQEGTASDGTFSLTGTDQKVILGKDVIAGVLNLDFMGTNPPGAHPYGLVGTWVIRKSNAQPVLLKELFTDFNAGLQRLSRVADDTLTQKYGDSLFKDGYAPDAKNFANWVPDSDGLTIYFPQGQVGAEAMGSVTLVVPWDKLDGVLSDKLY